MEDLVFHYVDFWDAMGWDKVNVVGLSLGGWIGAEFATRWSHRVKKLVLVDERNAVAATHIPDKGHPLYGRLAEAKAYYWDIYKEKVKLPAGMNLFKYAL